jgi:hypothetical protein
LGCYWHVFGTEIIEVYYLTQPSRTSLSDNRRRLLAPADRPSKSKTPLFCDCGPRVAHRYDRAMDESLEVPGLEKTRET